MWAILEGTAVRACAATLTAARCKGSTQSSTSLDPEWSPTLVAVGAARVAVCLAWAWCGRAALLLLFASVRLGGTGRSHISPPLISRARPLCNAKRVALLFSFGPPFFVCLSEHERKETRGKKRARQIATRGATKAPPRKKAKDKKRLRKKVLYELRQKKTGTNTAQADKRGGEGALFLSCHRFLFSFRSLAPGRAAKKCALLSQR